MTCSLDYDYDFYDNRNQWDPNFVYETNDIAKLQLIEGELRKEKNAAVAEVVASIVLLVLGIITVPILAGFILVPLAIINLCYASSQVSEINKQLRFVDQCLRNTACTRPSYKPGYPMYGFTTSVAAAG